MAEFFCVVVEGASQPTNKHIGFDWGFTKRTKFLVLVTKNQVILHDASDEFVGIWLVEASLAMRSFG